MIITALISLGLVIVPFFLPRGYDCREPKMALAIGIALSLGLWGLYKGILKPIKNIWACLFIGFLPLSVLMAPGTLQLKLFGADLTLFWVWKPLYIIMVFFLMFLTVSSYEFKAKEIKVILTIMSWVGFLMSFYMILQFFYIDQFVRNLYGSNFNLMGRVGGTIGQPTLVSAFVAMVIPIAIYLKKYIFAIIMFIAVCLTRSQVSIGAMVFSLMFLYGMTGKKQFISMISLSIILGSLLIADYVIRKESGIVSLSGRAKGWEQTYKDITEPFVKGDEAGHGITGYGIGSFHYLHRLKHHSNFAQAHNEYLELCFNTGIVGLGIFLCAIWYMVRINISFKDIFNKKVNWYRACLLSSFVCIGTAAGGNFVWQIAPMAFYTITIAGLLHNKGEAICATQENG